PMHRQPLFLRRGGGLAPGVATFVPAGLRWRPHVSEFSPSDRSPRGDFSDTCALPLRRWRAGRGARHGLRPRDLGTDLTRRREELTVNAVIRAAHAVTHP